tara:strand:- start:6406 stop:7737 length:1332 start_codon:yes stop_codon:yes gene_type:complete
MTAPNHVTGGIVFTGLFCSLFSINIFGNPLYIVVTIICSLLPDIDHTKSLIGKAFYPIAKKIAQSYGHRTITHSIFALIGITILASVIDSIYFENNNLTLIVFFSFFSHLLLDMLTLQGIPLFYPIYKNPCVLPANPELRIRTGNLKQEGIALFIFSLMTIFMQDLFANGFWTTLNKSFGSITHVNKEFKNTNNLMEVTYNYIEFGETRKGKGIVLESSKNEVKLFTNQEIITISKNNSNQKKIDLEFKLRKEIYKYITKEFIGITEKEINKICSNRVVKGTITSSETFILNGLSKVDNNLIFENTFSPEFKFMDKDTLKIKLNKELKIKQIQLNKIEYSNKENIDKYQKLINDKKTIVSLIKNANDIYSRNKFEKELIKISNKIDNYKIEKTDKLTIIEEIRFIKKLIKEDNKGTFSGMIQFLEIPDKTEDYKNSTYISTTD